MTTLVPTCDAYVFFGETPLLLFEVNLQQQTVILLEYVSKLLIWDIGLP